MKKHKFVTICMILVLICMCVGEKEPSPSTLPTSTQSVTTEAPTTSEATTAPPTTTSAPPTATPPSTTTPTPPTTTPIPTTTEPPKKQIEDNMLIGTYYYPWYDRNRHWQEGYKGDPVLGKYSSRDQSVISKHIEWACEYGIDFFLMSWWGPQSWEDITIKNYFLKSKDIDYIKFAILYETVGRLKVDVNGRINFDNPNNKLQLINDFKYLCNTYFDNDHYLKVDGKPVVFIYLARIFYGDYEGAISELRSEIRKEGYELYLIGDQVYWQSPYNEREKDLMIQFDAVTAYNMHASVQDIDKDFVKKVSEKYKEWSEVANDLHIDFIPDVMPGFDDTGVRPEARHPIIRRSINRFREFCEKARKYLSERNMILITSWNEWHEYTQIEPDSTYRESYLKVIKEMLANYR